MEVEKVGAVTVVQPADVECETCRQEYCAFLSAADASQEALSELSTAVNAFTVRRGKREGGSKNDRVAMPGHCMISTAFVNQLKNQVRWRRRLLTHPERCTVGFFRQCRAALDPTANLVCVGAERGREAQEHRALKQYLRKMDWVVIDDALWARLLTFFPAALRVEWWVPGRGLRRSDIPVCTLCKRKKTPKQVATPASPADAPLAPHRLTLPTAPKRRAVTAVVSSAVSTTPNTTTTTPTTVSATPTTTSKEDADSTGEYQPEDDWEAPHRAGRPKKEASHVVIRITLPQQPSTLCAAILDGSFTPPSLFDDSLSPAQHRETVLQTPCLQSLLARSLP